MAALQVQYLSVVLQMPHYFLAYNADNFWDRHTFRLPTARTIRGCLHGGRKILALGRS